jgi:RHS repeat-associated protein
LLGNYILFTSREFDFETGLYYNRVRYLDPFTGRWTTQDPLGFAAGDANLYRYVGNMATMATDPSGNIVWLPILLVGGAVLITGTSVAVNSGLPEYIGNNNPQWAGSSNDFFARWAHKVEHRTVSGIVSLPNGSVEAGTFWVNIRTTNVRKLGSSVPHSNYWISLLPPNTRRSVLRSGVSRFMLTRVLVGEGLWDAFWIIESGIEAVLNDGSDDCAQLQQKFIP